MSDGVQECLGFTAASTCRRQKALLIDNGVTECLLLVEVEWSIGCRQQAQSVMKEASSLRKQLGDRLALLEVR